MIDTNDAMLREAKCVILSDRHDTDGKRVASKLAGAPRHQRAVSVVAGVLAGLGTASTAIVDGEITAGGGPSTAPPTHVSVDDLLAGIAALAGMSVSASVR